LGWVGEDHAHSKKLIVVVDAAAEMKKCVTDSTKSRKECFSEQHSIIDKTFLCERINKQMVRKVKSLFCRRASIKS